MLDSTTPTSVSVLTSTTGAGSAPGADVTDPAPIRVLIVDDHPGFRSFARAMLEAEGFDVVGEAPDGAAALAAVRALAPEIVLLDVALPDMDGFAVCEALLDDAGGMVGCASAGDTSLAAGSEDVFFALADDPATAPAAGLSTFTC